MTKIGKNMKLSKKSLKRKILARNLMENYIDETMKKLINDRERLNENVGIASVVNVNKNCDDDSIEIKQEFDMIEDNEEFIKNCNDKRINFFKNWVFLFKVKSKCLTALLNFLKSDNYGLELPNDSRTLMKTPPINSKCSSTLNTEVEDSDHRTPQRSYPLSPSNVRMSVSPSSSSSTFSSSSSATQSLKNAATQNDCNNDINIKVESIEKKVDAITETLRSHISSVGTCTKNINEDIDFHCPALPISEVDDLQSFNNNCSILSYRNQMIIRLQKLVENKTATNDSKKIIKFYMEALFHYDLLFKYSWSGKSGLNRTKTEKGCFSSMYGVFQLFFNCMNYNTQTVSTTDDVESGIKNFLKHIQQNRDRFLKKHEKEIQRIGEGSFSSLDTRTTTLPTKSDSFVLK